MKNTKQATDQCPHCGEAIVIERIVGNAAVPKNKLSDFVICAGRLERYVGASTNVLIPDNVSIIGDHAFSNCSGLKSIQISNSVETIEDNAFFNCSGLTSLHVPDSVKIIKDSAFSKCSGLTSIKFSNNVTTIGKSTFAGCSSLKDIQIPERVKKIDSWAFQNCTNLTSVVIPDNVEEISYEFGAAPFSGCYEIAAYRLPATFIPYAHKIFPHSRFVIEEYRQKLIEERRSLGIFGSRGRKNLLDLEIRDVESILKVLESQRES